MNKKVRSQMFRRIAIIPFETAIAILLILSGVAGLFHYGIQDPLLSLLPSWEAYALNILAVLSGIFMVAGIAMNEARVELAGLLFLDAAILGRFFTYGHYLGYGKNFFIMGLFDLSILLASLIRKLSIRSKHVVIRFKELPAVIREDDNDDSGPIDGLIR